MKKLLLGEGEGVDVLISVMVMVCGCLVVTGITEG